MGSRNPRPESVGFTKRTVPHALERELLHAGIRVLRPHNVELQLLLEREILLRLRHHPTRQSGGSKNPRSKQGERDFSPRNSTSPRARSGADSPDRHPSSRPSSSPSPWPRQPAAAAATARPAPRGWGSRGETCLPEGIGGWPTGRTAGARVGLAELRGEPPPVACSGSEAAEGKRGSALPVLSV